MVWTKSSLSRPKQEGWYWIFIPPDYVERAWYDPGNFRWAVAEGAYFHDVEEVTHWQAYFAPAPPNAFESFLASLKNDV